MTNPIATWLKDLGIFGDAQTWAHHGMIVYLACTPMFWRMDVGLVTGGLVAMGYLIREAIQTQGLRGPLSTRKKLDIVMDVAAPLLVFVLQVIALR